MDGGLETGKGGKEVRKVGVGEGAGTEDVAAYVWTKVHCEG
jgi:hypothetical protein